MYDWKLKGNLVSENELNTLLSCVLKFENYENNIWLLLIKKYISHNYQ